MPLDVFNVEVYWVSDLYYFVRDELDFLEDLGDHTTFRIPGTKIYLFVFNSKIHWFYSPMLNEPVELNFEEAMDLLPEQIQEKFLYHLDVIRKSIREF